MSGQAAVMRYFTFWTDDEQAAGWVRAESHAEAHRQIGRDDVTVIEVPDDAGFPAEASGALHWDPPPVAG